MDYHCIKNGRVQITINKIRMIEQVKINIKEQLRASNMTIQQLCKLMRKDRKYIYRITEEVKLKKILEIAQYIGCNPSDLLKGL